MAKKRTLTGYRPTGKLHIGHWFGNLQNMLHHAARVRRLLLHRRLPRAHERLGRPQRYRAITEEMVLDWCAAGLDPEICTIYRQSDVPEVAELMLFFSMVLPMPWLERTPSYKEQRAQITTKDLGNVGFFLYPAPAGRRHRDRARRRRAGGRGPAAAPRADPGDRAPLQQHLRRVPASSRRRSSPRRARACRAPTAARCRRATATRSSSATPRTRSARRS